MSRAKRTVTILLVLTTLFIVLVASGCGGCQMIARLNEGAEQEEVLNALMADIFGESEQIYHTLEVALPEHAYFTPIEDKQAYARLTTEQQRTAYRAIEKSIFEFTDENAGRVGLYKLRRAYIPSLTSAEIFMVKEAVLADHPEAFWVEKNYTLDSNFREGDFMNLYSHCSFFTAQKRLRAVENAINDYLALVTQSSTEFERERLLHDKLVTECEYDVSAASEASTSDLSASDIAADVSGCYGALVNHRAVCGGYAAAMKLLLNRVGIACTGVRGVSEGVGHVWNLVQIDSEWYHLDPTWDDPITKDSTIAVSYDYFNVTDAQIRADHEIAPGFEQLTDELIISGMSGPNFYNFPLPTCDATENNFYVRQAVKIGALTSSSASMLSEELTRMAESGESLLYLSFDSSSNPQSAYNWLSSGKDSVLARCMKQANAKSERKIKNCILIKRNSDKLEHLDGIFCLKLVYDAAA